MVTGVDVDIWPEKVASHIFLRLRQRLATSHYVLIVSIGILALDDGDGPVTLRSVILQSLVDRVSGGLQPLVFLLFRGNSPS
jgi:hypothetical protein